MSKRISLTGSVAVLALALAVSGCGASSDSDPSTLKVSRFAGGDFVGHIMDEKGFFEKEGLDVEWQDVSTGPQGLNALASGSIDLLYGNVQLASGLLANGRKIEVVSGFVGPVFSIIGQKDAPTSWPESVSSLDGGSLAVPALGAAAEFISTSIVETAGLERSDLTFEATGGLPQGQAALESGKVDAVFATPAQDAMMRAKGFPVLFSWLDPDAYGGEAPEALTRLRDYSDFDYWADSAWVDKNEEAVEKFQAAVQAGQAWMQDPANLNEIITMLRGSEFDLADLDDATFKQYVQTSLDMMVTDYSVEAGNEWVSVMAAAGAPGMDKMPDASEWVNESFQDEK